MKQLRHTIGCNVTGYSDLAITIDLGMTNDQIARSQLGRVHGFVLDFPNWDEVAEALELSEDGKPLPKPTMPLTYEALDALPIVLVRYISGGYVISDALADYMETARPNLRRSLDDS